MKLSAQKKMCDLIICEWHQFGGKKKQKHNLVETKLEDR